MVKIPFPTDSRFLEEVREAVLQYARKHYGWSGLSLEDLTQEALLITFERVQNGKLTKLTSSLSTYVIGVLKKIAPGKLKTISKSPTGTLMQEQEEDDFVAPINLAIVQEVITKWENDDDEVELKKDAIHDIVIEMGDPCKTLLWSYYWEHKSMEMIAAQMGYKNADVAKSKKSNCMKKVKIVMEDFIKRINS